MVCRDSIVFPFMLLNDRYRVYRVSIVLLGLFHFIPVQGFFMGLLSFVSFPGFHDYHCIHGLFGFEVFLVFDGVHGD